jgi:hypothetical protein
MAVAGAGTRPFAQVTAIPEPVGDCWAAGVVPEAAGVAGHGSSKHLGKTQVLSGLQVAVPLVDQPFAQVTAIPEPVGDC